MLFVVMVATPCFVDTLPLLIACGMMLITGMIDDRRELSPLFRFIVQIVACCIMLF